MNKVTGFSWRSIFKMAVRHQKNFVLANFMSIIATLIALPLPLIIPSLINEVLLKQPGFFTKVLAYFLPGPLITPTLILMTAFLLVFMLRVINEILTIIQGREFKLISKDIVYQMRVKLLTQLGNISVKEYETLGAGTLASYYTKDLETIDEFLGASIRQAVIALLALVGVAVVLLIINWKIALFLFFFNPLSLVLTSKFSKKLKELKTRQNKAFELFQEALSETIDVMLQIKADHQESSFIQRLTGHAKRIKEDSIAYEWKTEVVNDLAGMLLFVGVDLYYIFAMTLVLLGQFTIGMMVALLQYVFQVQWYMNNLVNMLSAFYAADAALARINQAMKLETEPQYPAQKNPFVVGSGISIEFKNVSFGYLPEKPVLTQLNMQLDANKRIGVVGASGAGKSSLVQALLGFYHLTSGDILINDDSIYDVGFDIIRENICTVLQSPAVFNDTIRNNLALDKSVNDDALWRALELAQLKETVQLFDEQLDTRVGKRGVRLSGGQRQRLAIARMLLQDAKVVILDEATSALDLKTEQQLFQAIHGFLSQRTTLIITHRLSTIMDADQICVLNQGAIVEQGTHAELLKIKKIYYSLFTLQQANISEPV